METLIVRNDEVVGSIPTSSTNLSNNWVPGPGTNLPYPPPPFWWHW